MYKGFNLHLDRDDIEWCIGGTGFKYFKTVGKNLWDDQKEIYRTAIKAMVKRKEINGSRVQEDWFPEVEADIFISHSHKDEDLACALAGWIYENFGLKCFIDANVWGYADELKKEMNDSCSDKKIDENGHCIYNYENCNQVSNHVDTMLTIALHKMIDKTEAVFLLNTDSAITVSEDDKMNKVYSAWIYSELICTQIVRKKPLLVYRDCYQSMLEHSDKSQRNFSCYIPIFYEVNLSHLTDLSPAELQKWLAAWQQNSISNGSNSDYSALDFLYSQVCRAEWLNEQFYILGLSGEERMKIQKLYGVAKKEKKTLYLEKGRSNYFG